MARARSQWQQFSAHMLQGAKTGTLEENQRILKAASKLWKQQGGRGRSRAGGLTRNPVHTGNVAALLAAVAGGVVGARIYESTIAPSLHAALPGEAATLLGYAVPALGGVLGGQIGEAVFGYAPGGDLLHAALGLAGNFGYQQMQSGRPLLAASPAPTRPTFAATNGL